MQRGNYLERTTEFNARCMRAISSYGRTRRANRPRLSEAALLVIDVQNFFLDQRSHAFVPAGKAILPNIRKLVHRFRNARRPVIFTRYATKKRERKGAMERWWNDQVEDGTRASRISKELKPLPRETVIRKKGYSAFYGTGLEAMLHRKKVRSLVITGLLTHICCEMAAREAFVRDFDAYIVLDGTATYTEELHVGSLRSMAHGCAVALTTDETMQMEGSERA